MNTVYILFKYCLYLLWAYSCHLLQILFISILGSFGLMAILVLCGILLSLFISTSTYGESAFIGACFSLSSTPLVLKFTSTTKDCKYLTHMSIKSQLLRLVCFYIYVRMCLWMVNV